MFKKNYRRREVLNDFNFGLKQKFNIKCGLDLSVFVVLIILFVNYAMKHDTAPYESLGYFLIMLAIFVPTHFISKQWISRAIRKSITSQSESLSDTTNEIIETLNSQKKIIDTLALNSKNISNSIVIINGIYIDKKYKLYYIYNVIFASVV